MENAMKKDKEEGDAMRRGSARGKSGSGVEGVEAASKCEEKMGHDGWSEQQRSSVLG